ncbi:MAG: hypothetical protein V4565_02930 [Bacteroidota bacterium]
MTPFQNPTIYLGDLRIDEPVTAFTNLMFVAMCLFAFLNTKEQRHFIGPNLYRWFFLAIGLSALIAAFIGHAFLYHFGFGAKIYGWEANILGVAFAQTAAIYHTRPSIKESVFKTLLIVSYIQIAVAMVLTYTVFSFIVVEIHSAISLLFIVCVLEGIHYKNTRSILSKYMLIGVGVTVFAVIVHVFKLAISVWFNHLDLSHIIMCGSIYCFYRGVKLNTNSKSISHDHKLSAHGTED